LIGGIGTLTGAYVGAAVFRLMQFFLDKWFGEISSFLIGLVYVLLVLFIPFGIVGTWRVHAFRVKQGRQYLARLLSGGAYQQVDEEEDI
jgi:branched-chain amino acid transport system permease protein